MQKPTGSIQWSRLATIGKILGVLSLIIAWPCAVVFMIHSPEPIRLRP